MSVTRRKDNKGSVLGKGEGHRKSDLMYFYRYIDAAGKRKSLYSTSLEELREKEDEIQALEKTAPNYAEGGKKQRPKAAVATSR